MLTFETGRTHFEQPLTRLRTPAQLPFLTLSKRFRCRSGRGCRQLKMDTFRLFSHRRQRHFLDHRLRRHNGRHSVPSGAATRAAAWAGGRYQMKINVYNDARAEDLAVANASHPPARPPCRPHGWQGSGVGPCGGLAAEPPANVTVMGTHRVRLVPNMPSPSCYTHRKEHEKLSLPHPGSHLDPRGATVTELNYLITLIT